MGPSDTVSVLDISVIIRDPVWNASETDSPDGSDLEVICLETAKAAFRATRTPDNDKALCEACIVLAGDDFVADLNQRYRAKEGPTNVLSFAAQDNEEDDAALPDLPEGMPILLGDVIIAHGVVSREAEKMGIPLINHLRHLVVHGILHLLGYDHMEQEEALEMEGLEIQVLATMGVDNPYADEDGTLT